MTLLHIDTDLGVDDALALFAVTRIRGLRVGGLSSVFGNVPLDVASRNARLMRHLLAPALDVPLLTGASGPQGEAPEGDARSVHGDDGLGGATASLDPAVLVSCSRPGDADLDLPAQIAAGPPPWLRPGEKITLVGLGPATNLPALARWYGSALARIVLLSGAFFDRGNITPAAEFNAWCDPPALAQTLALGVPVTFVPLDLCRKILLTTATIENWQQRDPSPAMAFLGEAHRHYVESYRRTEAIDGCFPHDTIAILAAYRPDAFFSVTGDIEVATSGEDRGRTRIVAGSNSPHTVLTGGDLSWIRRGLETVRFSVRQQ